MMPDGKISDTALDELLGGRKLTDMEKGSLYVYYGTGIGAAAFSIAAEAILPGGAKMLSDAIYNDGDVPRALATKLFGDE